MIHLALWTQDIPPKEGKRSFTPPLSQASLRFHCSCHQRGPLKHCPSKSHPTEEVLCLQTRERHSCSVFCLFCLDNFLLPVIRLLLGLFSRGGTLVSLSLFHRHTLRDFPMVVCGNNESPVHGNAHEIVLVTHN